MTLEIVRPRRDAADGIPGGRRGTVPGRAQPLLAAQIRRLGALKRALYLLLYEQGY